MAIPFVLAFGKAFKIDFASILDADTLTALGIQDAPSQTSPKPANTPNSSDTPELKNVLNEQAYSLSARFLLSGVNKEEYTNILSAIA